MSKRPVAVVVLAAGKGTRMKSALPKVIHPVIGRTVVGWVLAAVESLNPERVVVVTGHQAETVEAALPNELGSARVDTARQVQQRGSGDALAAAMPKLSDFSGDVLVVNGDGALFTAETMQQVVSEHQRRASAATALAIQGDTELPYGRIIRGEDDRVEAIVEAVDATAEQLKVDELNAGVYCFDVESLRQGLPRLSDDNAKGELYITDLLAIAREDNATTLAVVAGGPDELIGINDRLDLSVVEEILRRRIAEQHMRNGVTISLPNTVLIEPTVTISADARIEPGTILRGNTVIASGAVVGPNSDLEDTKVEAGAIVEHSVTRSATIAEGALVGPFAYLRPNAQLRANAKAGAFVEIKNSVIGEGSKVPHLSYVGDATIGKNSNIGAGNITANYRPELGKAKQKTIIGDNVRTGSDCVFVAPVTLGNDAWTAAGSIVVEDVPAGALAVARSRQSNIDGWVARSKDKQPTA